MRLSVAAPILGALLVAAIILFVGYLRSPAGSGPAPAAPAPAAPPHPAVVRPAAPALRGPWGQLVLKPLLLRPSPNQAPGNSCRESRAPWRFPGVDRDGVRAVLAEAGLDEALVEQLAAAASCGPAGTDCAITPDDALVLSLPTDVRARLYLWLSRFRENPLHRAPIRIRTSTLAAQLDRTALKADTRRLLEQAGWIRGDFTLLSDLGAACRASSRKDRGEIEDFLLVSNALLVKLKIGQDTDVAALAEYWDKNVKRKDTAQLLRSFQRSGGLSLDIIHLLPPLPRKLLYTFPEPHQAHLGCDWTAFNFLTARADDRFNDPAEVRRALAEDYVDVTGAPRAFGDLVLFETPEGTLTHSCAYLAADIVFTKNGIGPRHPWVLMRLADVEDLYAADEGTRITFVRHKDLR